MSCVSDEDRNNRVGVIVGFDSKSQVQTVCQQSIEIYREYLKQNLVFPCILMFRERYNFELFYTVGRFYSKARLERRRQRDLELIYTDHYKLEGLNELEFEAEIRASEGEEDAGIVVMPPSIRDNRGMLLYLFQFKVVDSNSKNYVLIEDYSAWIRGECV